MLAEYFLSRVEGGMNLSYTGLFAYFNACFTHKQAEDIDRLACCLTEMCCCLAKLVKHGVQFPLERRHVF